MSDDRLLKQVVFGIVEGQTKDEDQVTDLPTDMPEAGQTSILVENPYDSLADSKLAWDPISHLLFRRSLFQLPNP